MESNPVVDLLPTVLPGSREVDVGPTVPLTSPQGTSGTEEENGPVVQPFVQPFVQPWTSASATAYAIQHVDSHEFRNGIQSDPWRTQTMRRNKREGPRKRDTISILGTGTADTIEIKVAPEPSRYIFVFRLHSDINCDKLKNYLESKNIITRNVECISHPDSKSRSFKLSVPKSMFKTVFDATLCLKV